MPSLLKTVRAVFEKIPDVVKRKTTYSLPDCLMSALAMFSLKYPSLLQFDNDSRKDQHITDNLKTLFGIAQVTSDIGCQKQQKQLNLFLELEYMPK